MNFPRLRACFAILTGRILVPAGAYCARCDAKDRRIDDLDEQVRYWRTREERTSDAFFASKGVQSLVASPPKPRTDSPMAIIAQAAGIQSFDSRKTPSRAAGQGANDA